MQAWDNYYNIKKAVVFTINIMGHPVLRYYVPYIKFLSYLLKINELYFDIIKLRSLGLIKAIQNSSILTENLELDCLYVSNTLNYRV